MTERTNRPIFMRIYGGLGNQFFQYFAGQYFSRELEREFYVDFNWLTRELSHSNSDIRDFKFFQGDNIFNCKTRSDVKQFFEHIITSVALRSDSLACLLKMDTTVGYRSLKSITRSGTSKFRGYYQDPYYFDQVKNSINCEFLELIDDLRIESYSKIKERQSNVIAVHVRGGDYLKKPKIYASLSFEYYMKAIGQLLERFPGSQIQIFTNDQIYAKSVLGSKNCFVFFDDKGLRPSHVLQHMAASRALVTANSTFSLWAGLLGKPENVVSPKFWFIDKRDFIAYPEDWIQI